MSEQGLGAGDGVSGAAMTALYTRPMPGGGYVRVELVNADREVSDEVLRGRVVMDGRTAPRTIADEPLVVEEVEGKNANDVVAELFRIARDNAAIARRLMRRRSAPRAD